MSFPIEESSLLTSQYLYEAALIFAVVRWIISWILRSIDSDNSSVTSSASKLASTRAICESLELTTYGDLAAESCSGGGGETCAVCLNGMEEQDKVRRLRCCHVFHAECIEKWVQYDHEHGTCPMCRAPLVMGCSNGLGLGAGKSEPSWAVERMIYIFGDDELYI